MPLVIVRRSQLAVFGKLSQAFAGEADVRLIWDRRVQDRRRQTPPRAVAERRQEHRRDPSASWDDREYVVISATAHGLALDLEQRSITSVRALIRSDDPTRDVRHDLETDVRSDINALMTDGDPVSGTRQQTAMTRVDRLLLIDGDPAEARVVREALADSRDGPFEVEWVTRLSDGLDRLRRNGIRAILLNMFLPDAEGLETFERLHLAAPQMPILILSALANEDLARHAAQHGGQDYLRLDHLDSYTLPQALRHVIDRKAVEDALFIEKERAQVTLNSIGDAVLSTDTSSHVTYLNLVAESMTGWSREEASGKPLAEVFQTIDGVTREPARNPLALAVQLNKTVDELTPNCVLIRRDGFEAAIEDSASAIHDRGGQVIGAVVVFHYVSAARAMSLQSAQHDFLTDLPNRLLLNDRLTQAISLARRQGSHLAVLFVDLDGFKPVNDSMGHAIGDQLLQSVAERLVTCVRGSDTVSRQGGDEFVVLLSHVEHAEDAAVSARKMLTALSVPHGIAQHAVQITASIGVSIYPDDGQHGEALIKAADAAMYRAKATGGNNYQFFGLDLTVRSVDRQSVEGDLSDAVERQQFVLHYQPKMNLETGAINGVEALLRWQHPTRGLVLPADFVPLAEASRLIVPIGQWVLREACRQARAWLDADLRAGSMAVNISAAEFRHKDFLDNLRAILEDTRLDPRHLELELTETALMQHAQSTAVVLRAIKAVGVQLAVDNFGTGYSSLSQLKQFPIDALKVDQSFVHGITTDPDDALIVSAAISMGRSLKQRVIAEGVETREQLAFIQAQRCGEGQGYYFSQAVTGAQFAELLQTGIPWH
jgi:diguanylate cyclase (GGDEF)-like protein/PAS domain S-box-containing protein